MTSIRISQLCSCRENPVETVLVLVLEKTNRVIRQVLKIMIRLAVIYVPLDTNSMVNMDPGLGLQHQQHDPTNSTTIRRDRNCRTNSTMIRPKILHDPTNSTTIRQILHRSGTRTTAPADPSSPRRILGQPALPPLPLLPSYIRRSGRSKSQLRRSTDTSNSRK